MIKQNDVIENSEIINVIDSPCGSGKSKYAIRRIADGYVKNKRYIFVTPYINEINRVLDEVNGRAGAIIYTPEGNEYGKTKYKNFLELIKQNKNICTTHQLFSYADDELLDLLDSLDYELILDEVMTVVSPLKLTKTDSEDILIKKGFIVVNDDEKVALTEEGKKLLESNDSVFHNSLKMIKSDRVIALQKSMFLWLFPVNILKSFSNITILTYLFKYQSMHNYLKINGFDFEYYHLVDYQLVKGRSSYDGSRWKDLIDIYYGNLNKIGDKAGSLSKSFFINRRNISKIKQLGNNARNYLKNQMKKKSSESLFTCFKSPIDSKLIEVKDYKSSFLALNARASNDYKDRDTLVYLVNRYENTLINNYFIKNNYNIDNEMFALSEMIQWIFRSAIREGKPINIYIPSKRMRTILEDFLDDKIEEEMLNVD